MGVVSRAPPLNATLPSPDNSIGWGQITSYALRQPVLAQDMGLIYSLTLPLSAAEAASGGFLSISLDTSLPTDPWMNDFTTNAAQ